MLIEEIKKLYPAHATPGFLEFLKEQIGVEVFRVLEDVQFYIYWRDSSYEEVANLIKEEI